MDIKKKYMLMELPKIIEGKEEILNEPGIVESVEIGNRSVDMEGLKLPKFMKNRVYKMKKD